MYLVPQVPLRVTRANRRQLAGMLRYPRRVALSGLGCNCRGGHYLTGLGDNGSFPTDPYLINLINNPSVDMPDVPTALPPELSPTPVSIPLPNPIFNAPIAVAQPPMKLPNISNLLNQPPILPGTGAPNITNVARNTVPNPAPAVAKASWLDEQTIPGVPNKFLVGGVLGVMVLGAMAGKKRR